MIKAVNELSTIYTFKSVYILSDKTDKNPRSDDPRNIFSLLTLKSRTTHLVTICAGGSCHLFNWIMQDADNVKWIGSNIINTWVWDNRFWRHMLLYKIYGQMTSSYPESCYKWNESSQQEFLHLRLNSIIVLSYIKRVFNFFTHNLWADLDSFQIYMVFYFVLLEITKEHF